MSLPYPTRARMFGIARELWPFLILGSLVYLAMWGFASTEWEDVFFLNGDSLVLPQLNRSLEAGEPFEWVFSTQSFLFPEFSVYTLLALIPGGPRVTIALNAFFNVFALYALLRAVAVFSAPGRRTRQVVFALLASSVFMLSVLLEHKPHVLPPGLVHPTVIATLFLLTTYYYGVILVALASLVLTLWFTRGLVGGAATLSRVACYAVPIVVLSALTMYSNPLYGLQYVLPLLVTAIVLCGLRRLRLSALLVIAGAHTVGVLIGLGFRVVFADYLATSLDKYVNPDRMGDAASILSNVVISWASGPLAMLKLLLLVLTLGGSLAYVSWAIVRLRTGRPRTLPLFITLFVVVSAGSLLVGQIVTGQHLTRYLVPLFIFPLLGIVLLAGVERGLPRVFGRPAFRFTVVSVTTALALALLVASAGPVTRMLDQPQPPSAACLDDWLDGGASSGVGTFMTTRDISLYGVRKGKVLQVVPDLSVHAWLNNLSPYTNLHVSYVLVDPTELTPAVTVAALGAPASIVECSDFAIYDYAGTPGEAELNKRVAVSLAQVRLSRGYAPS